MATIQWRPEVNAFTVPQSYKSCYVSRGSVGMAEEWVIEGTRSGQAGPPDGQAW